MQVTFNNNPFRPNYKTSIYTQKTSSVNFNGGKLPLIPVAEESFRAETSKKMLSKIKKYIRLIGDGGRIENVKILNETSTYYDSTDHLLRSFYSEADVFLAITKKKETANITLSRKYKKLSKEGFVIFNADFDKNGQMIYGKFPLEGLRFERIGNNVRRMYRDKKIFLPIQGKDKDWEHAGRDLLAGDRRVLANDDSTKGAFEIFLELARLRTSIYK